MAIARSQMYRQLYGIGNLVKREEYGIGSKLKKFVRKIIPNEVAEIAVKAAPFVAPFNPLLAGAMAGFGGFDQTGRIGQSLKSAALTYGAGQLGRYIGGAGFQEGINPFAGYSSSGSFGGLGSLFTNPIGTRTGLQLGQYEIFGGPGSEQFKLNQNAITPQQTYLGGDTVRTIPVETGPVSTTPVETFNPRDVYDPNIDYSGAGTRYGDPTPLPPAKEQGYFDLIKKAGSLEDIPLSERFGAVKDIGSKALQDVLYKPMINPKTGATTYILDKNVVGSIAIGAYSYYDALQKLKDAGDPEPEKTLTEEEYQRLRIDPEKAKYKDVLKEESFGIRKAEGGRITDRKNYFLGKMVSATSVAQPGETMSQGGGSGLGGMIANLIQRNPEMFRRVMNPPRLLASSRKDFIDNDGNGIDDREEAANGGLMNEGVLSITLTPANREKFQVGGMKKDMSNNRISQIIQLIRDAESIGDMEKAEELRLDLFRETKKAKGGKITYPMGSEIPVRQNQGGITELDLRNKGGFIPVGIKEKADDVPAMLSKNEFVFTADAVRGAGKGSINKGAQKMYKLMKSLEKKVKKQKVK
jgi:hypothetical protein